MADPVLISTHDLAEAGRIRTALEASGISTQLVTDGRDLERYAPDAGLLVVTDVSMPAGAALARAGSGILEGVRVFGVLPELPEGGLGGLAERLGIAEFFPSGGDPADLVLLATRALEHRRLQEATGIVGESEAIREVLERILQIAPVQSTVLVTGESGTGKELVARGIHALSPRRHRSFIAVNVAALPDTLLESELFGHEKGAFTGAVDARRGLFELADRGTIFLDEIGEMPLSTQTKLLRVLEQREFLRLGGEKPTRVDVRIIAATNQDLRAQVEAGGFRRDLYYRLNVLRVELPPLRARPGDIPLLVRRFVKQVSEANDRPFVGISPEAMALLRAHSWPGNIRELRNLVESMVVLSPGRVIRPEDIPAEIRLPRPETRLLPPPLQEGRALPAPLGGRPVPVAQPASGPLPVPDLPPPGIRPELEFIFRTLVDLRVDLDQLRGEFAAWRERASVEADPFPRWAPVRVIHEEEAQPVSGPGEELPGDESGDGPGAVRTGADLPTVLLRPGTTMEDIEREAIRAALLEEGGNRRRAAERLGIGERTLYRKIQRFGLDD